MSATIEKGSPAESRPIPKVVLPDTTEPKASLLNLQVARLTAACGVNADMAATLAPMVFGVLLS